jgi:hypothetical protein
VNVHVQVQRRAKALDDRDGAAAATSECCEVNEWRAGRRSALAETATIRATELSRICEAAHPRHKR